MSTLVAKWKNELFNVLGNNSSADLAPVRMTSFQNAETLVNQEILLRSSSQLQKSEAIELLNFDPNFQVTNVVCRYKNCEEKNQDPAVQKFTGKRDLYLCEGHRRGLTRKVLKMCKEQKVEVEHIFTPTYESEDLSGYIQLIPLLEKIYREAVMGRALKEAPRLAQEAVLNVRNFLIITNAVLNPDDDNAKAVLPPICVILLDILESKKKCDNLLYLLRGVIQEILFAFGVMYNWVYLGMNNPGGMIGAGVGGVLGMIGGAVLGPWSAAGFAAGGATFGALIGAGIYNLYNDKPHVCGFEFEGDAWGDLRLRING